MSYPLSADVAAGDLTAASQYNNLRADALRLGQAAADAVNLGSLMEAFESRLNIIRLNTTQVRVEASAVAPVDLLVAGFPVRVVANVDLAIGDAPSGAAANWYIFANRAASSSAFTLSVSTSSTEGANQRRIGQFYWDGALIVKDSIQTEFSLLLQKLLYFKESMPQCGRLSAATNDPTPSADVSTTSLIYFSPYNGNRVSLYVPNYGWRTYPFSEMTLDISGYTSGKNYDVFLYDNAGVLTLEGVVWSNDSLRSVALASQDGRWVKNGYPHKLYLGTIRCHSAGVTRDTTNSRLVWNMYNRVHRPIKIIVSTDSWTYATAAWRQWNADAANSIFFVIGVANDPVYLLSIENGNNAAYNNSYVTGVCLDASNTNQSLINNELLAPQGYRGAAISVYNSVPAAGYHYLALVEYVLTSTVTFFGDNGAALLQSGGAGWLLS
jgi:hypothetical protein